MSFIGECIYPETPGDDVMKEGNDGNDVFDHHQPSLMCHLRECVYPETPIDDVMKKADDGNDVSGYQQQSEEAQQRHAHNASRHG